MIAKELVVIGGGPAGLSAAIAAWEDGVRDMVVLEREHQPGGILRQCIHNGFGLHRFGEELTGPEYAQRDIDRARALGIPIACDTTVLEVTPEKVVTCVSARDGLQVIQANTIVLAMGCRERPRGALGTPGTRCAGVYTAGTAQRFVNLEGFMPGKRVVILGSGDIGLIMARRMTLQGAQVKACVELMPYSSGLNRNIVQCLHDYDIPLYLSHTVTRIEGKERLTGVTVAKVGADRRPIPGTEFHIDCDTLLLSVGLIPENELSKGAGVDLSLVTSGAVVDDALETSVPGIFACGNVLHVHDLVDYVSEESARAGHAAAQWIREGERAAETLNVVDGDGIRGVVPQRIRRDLDGEVRLMFRPAAVYKNASVVARCGARELARKKAMIFAPGEMAVMTLRADKLEGLDDDIVVSMEAAQ